MRPYGRRQRAAAVSTALLVAVCTLLSVSGVCAVLGDDDYLWGFKQVRAACVHALHFHVCVCCCVCCCVCVLLCVMLCVAHGLHCSVLRSAHETIV